MLLDEMLLGRWLHLDVMLLGQRATMHVGLTMYVHVNLLTGNLYREKLTGWWISKQIGQVIFTHMVMSSRFRSWKSDGLT
jgi:hypothetical protein